MRFSEGRVSDSPESETSLHRLSIGSSHLHHPTNSKTTYTASHHTTRDNTIPVSLQTSTPSPPHILLPASSSPSPSLHAHLVWIRVGSTARTVKSSEVVVVPILVVYR